MTEWVARRFWSDVAVVEEQTGFGIRLDARPLRTPAKALMVLPTQALAEAVAAEWMAQDEKINPLSMPFTRTSNSAIDNVAPNRAQIADLVAEYGTSDLLCYRADGPAELVARQAAAWDPVLAWAAETLGAHLAVATGIMHVSQPDESIAVLSKKVHTLDPFQLAALHDLATLSGSLVLGFAVFHRFAGPERIWDLSRIDETWQAELWGADDEAAQVAEAKRRDFLHAATVLRLLTDP